MPTGHALAQSFDQLDCARISAHHGVDLLGRDVKALSCIAELDPFPNLITRCRRDGTRSAYVVAVDQDFR